MKILITANGDPKYKVKDRVIVNFGTLKKPVYYIGTVSKVDTKVHVAFDDGDEGSYKPTRTKVGLVGKSSIKKKHPDIIPTEEIDKWLAVDLGEAKPKRKAKTNTVKKKKEPEVNRLDDFDVIDEEDDEPGKPRKPRGKTHWWKPLPDKDDVLVISQKVSSKDTGFQVRDRIIYQMPKESSLRIGTIVKLLPGRDLRVAVKQDGSRHPMPDNVYVKYESGFGIINYASQKKSKGTIERSEISGWIGEPTTSDTFKVQRVSRIIRHTFGSESTYALELVPGKDLIPVGSPAILGFGTTPSTKEYPMSRLKQMLSEAKWGGKRPSEFTYFMKPDDFVYIQENAKIIQVRVEKYVKVKEGIGVKLAPSSLSSNTYPSGNKAVIGKTELRDSTITTTSDVTRLKSKITIPTEAIDALLHREIITDTKDIKWGADDVGAWHKLSFANAPEEVQLAVINTPPPPVTLVRIPYDPKMPAYYDPSSHKIAVSDLYENRWEGKELRSKLIAVWQHEFGHALDRRLDDVSQSSEFMVLYSQARDKVLANPNFTLPDQGAFNRTDGIVEFFEPFGGFETYVRYPKSFRKNLKDGELSSDVIGLVDLRDSIKGFHMESMLKELTGVLEFRQSKDSNPERVKTALKDWENLDSLADLFGALTFNKVGRGHENEYYRDTRKGPIEAWAQLFTLVSSNGPLTALTDHLLPDLMGFVRAKISKASTGAF